MKPSDGYIWRYSEDKITQEFIDWCNSKREFIYAKDTKIRQYTKKGDFIFEYDNLILAEKETGIERRYIMDCCKGNIKSAGGFKWEFVCEEVSE